MEKFIINFKNDSIIKVHTSSNNTCILDSYIIKSIKDMSLVLDKIREIGIKGKCTSVNYRNKFSMINEWRVHNLLYALGIYRDRTRSVDLETKQPWYLKILYTLISPFYLHFT